jgi:hypothetical protein
MDVNFGLFAINIPDYLIMRARTTAAPGAEVTRTVLGPGQTGIMNFLMVGLDPVNHYFDLYESVDGVALNNLLGTFTYDVKNEKIVDEMRSYVVGSGINNAPSDTDTSFTDPYLDGKNVTEFSKRSIGQLLPDDSSGLPIEWSIAGTTITLGAGLVFTDQETYFARISYLVQDTSPAASSGFFQGIKIVTADVTMDNTYYNNRVKCNGTGTQLVITFGHYADIPDGKFWYFMDQDGGAQYQTKFVLQDGNFLFNGQNYGELWMGKGDCLWIEKNGAIFEVIKPSDVMINVGKRSSESLSSFLNMYPEDNSLWGADDLPALWYWITHALPTASYYLLDDNLDLPGYTRPVDINGKSNKAGLFIISLTKRKFRFPDTQGLSERGSKSFTIFGADGQRLYDYPGGLMLEMVGPHDHEIQTFVAVGNGGTKPVGFRDTTSAGILPHGYFVKNNIGTENRVNNISVIYMRHA